jgi:hypothetical protein
LDFHAGSDSSSYIFTELAAGTSGYAYYFTPCGLGAAAEDDGTSTSLGLSAAGRAARCFGVVYAAFAAGRGDTTHAGVGRAAAGYAASAGLVTTTSVGLVGIT